MEDVIVAIFDTAQRAYDGLNDLDRLGSDGVIELYAFHGRMQESGGVVFPDGEAGFRTQAASSTDHISHRSNLN
jgi:hypothetical protein